MTTKGTDQFGGYKDIPSSEEELPNATLADAFKKSAPPMSTPVLDSPASNVDVDIQTTTTLTMTMKTMVEYLKRGGLQLPAGRVRLTHVSDNDNIGDQEIFLTWTEKQS